MILSRNYAKSPVYLAEVRAIASRVAILDPDTWQRRIFRVDRQLVPEDEIPEPLRNIKSVKFFTRADLSTFLSTIDLHPKIGGRISTSEYEQAVQELALAVYQRVDELYGLASMRE